MKNISKLKYILIAFVLFLLSVKFALSLLGDIFFFIGSVVFLYAAIKFVLRIINGK